MEAYRVTLSHLATGTIIQLCLYMLVQPSLCHKKCDIIIYGLCHLTDIVLSLVQPQFVSNYI